MTKKILIVEDEEKIVKMLLIIFKLEDYEVLCAGDGEEALRIARADNPDLILLDVRIPKIDGYEVCRSVKSEPTMSHMKVLMVSGMVQNYELQKAREVGADGYITKPFNTRVLLEKIEDLLGK
jgi:two-component system alkaline phosphatase synthesis response regulator PhoP